MSCHVFVLLAIKVVVIGLCTPLRSYHLKFTCKVVKPGFWTGFAKITIHLSYLHCDSTLSHLYLSIYKNLTRPGPVQYYIHNFYLAMYKNSYKINLAFLN